MIQAQVVWIPLKKVRLTMSFKTRFFQLVNDYLKMGYSIENSYRYAIADIQNEVNHKGKLYPFNFKETKPLENCFTCVSKNKISPIIS